jgi:hypothetical protein
LGQQAQQQEFHQQNVIATCPEVEEQQNNEWQVLPEELSAA